MSLDALFGAETRFSTLGVVQRAATGRRPSDIPDKRRRELRHERFSALSLQRYTGYSQRAVMRPHRGELQNEKVNRY